MTGILPLFFISAACQGQNDLFFAPAGERPETRNVREAKARAVIRAAKKLDAGAFIFEIARSEIGYTEQRPHEYAAILCAAALREGFTGPLFIQGDHVQTNAKKYNSPERDKELETLRGLIREEIAAGFYNIDIDTSTLVDLDKLVGNARRDGEDESGKPTAGADVDRPRRDVDFLDLAAAGVERRVRPLAASAHHGVPGDARGLDEAHDLREPRRVGLEQ